MNYTHTSRTRRAVSVECNREALPAFTASLSYVPPQGFVGTDVITTVVNDRGYTGAGGTGLGTNGLVFGSNVGIAAPLAVTNVQDLGTVVAQMLRGQSQSI